jgi:hypothetical protein
VDESNTADDENHGEYHVDDDDDDERDACSPRDEEEQVYIPWFDRRGSRRGE